MVNIKNDTLDFSGAYLLLNHNQNQDAHVYVATMQGWTRY